MPRLSNTCWSVKSPPTTPTILTFVKKLAEIEKCDAEPPSILSHFPKGVSTASYATDPTTRRDMCVFCLRLFRCLERAQLLLRLLRVWTGRIVVNQFFQVVAAHLAKL